MAKVLSGYRGLGKQTSSGVFRDSSGSAGSFIGGVPMAQSATTSNGSDPQGVEFFVAIRMADQTIEANRSHFEYMIASYDLTSSVYTWNRVSTIDSSNGGAAVDWESITTDENSLTFYAITPHTLFSNEDVFEATNYVDLAANASGVVCDDITITPENDYLNLILEGYIHYQAVASSTTTYALPDYSLRYRNSGGSWVNLFNDFAGHRSGSYSAQTNYGHIPILEKLTSSHLNSSGDWELRFEGDTTGSSTPLVTDRIKLKTKQVAF